ncbi:hypothetical protein RMN57_23605 [Kitasatospora sp. CM 4170]|uniref:Uncharacterized protein n=1 Tax=Kitasatospora aburaviensis TaxID=67265 RepID=A0ABW1EVA7_9ACTN|nr:hypothetical protein [Kitasatospora sp. CM 4170]WNM47471.1 hypothetical protein RMN57_23605 [Kitasatospora sp. CM 4170]
MDPELAALASTAATALVTAWTTDAWTGLKQGLGRLIGRGNDHRAAVVAADLATTQTELAAADATGDLDRVAQVEQAWRDRLRLLLAEDPAAEAELRLILDDFERARSNSAARDRDHLEVHHNTFHGPVQLKGVQNNRG